jgi:hypothetical protein
MLGGYAKSSKFDRVSQPLITRAKSLMVNQHELVLTNNGDI